MESTNALKTGWMQRTRYTGVFILLLAALFCITDTQRQYRQRTDSGFTYRKDHIYWRRRAHTGSDHLEDPPAAHLMAADSWRRTVTCGLSSADVLCQSHSRTV